MTTRKKTCNKCGKRKPLTEFYAHKRAPDGVMYECKVCKRLRQKMDDVAYQPSHAAIHGHIMFRSKAKESAIDLDKTKDKFKVFAHNLYLFKHYDKQKAINRAAALGYFESSINFVMIKPTKTAKNG